MSNQQLLNPIAISKAIASYEQQLQDLQQQESTPARQKAIRLLQQQLADLQGKEG